VWYCDGVITNPMNPHEQVLLEELKKSLDGSLQKEVADAYIAKNSADAIIEPLLKFLEQEIAQNETV
jgi:hypothetical protein